MKKFLDEKASVEILEASLIYPIVIIISLILLLYSFIPLIEIYEIVDISKVTNEVSDYYEFSNKGYLEGKENIGRYRYIGTNKYDKYLENTFDVEIDKGIRIKIKGEKDIKKNIFFFNKGKKIEVNSKVIDQDEFIRNIDLIIFVSNEYFSEDIEKINGLMNERINKYFNKKT